MDYLEYAKQIERNGIEYYEKLKNESDTAEVKSIFSFMERQEQRHLEIFEAWQKEMEPTPIEAENEPRGYNRSCGTFSKTRLRIPFIIYYCRLLAR